MLQAIRMAPRHILIPPPVEPAEPEIQKALIIKADLSVPGPGAFKGYVSEDDLADIAKRDRKMLLALSIIEQYSDWQTQTIVNLYAHVRTLDRNAAIDRRDAVQSKKELAEAMAELAKQKATKAKFKWAGVTFGAGLIAALAKALIDWLVK